MECAGADVWKLDMAATSVGRESLLEAGRATGDVGEAGRAERVTGDVGDEVGRAERTTGDVGEAPAASFDGAEEAGRAERATVGGAPAASAIDSSAAAASFDGADIDHSVDIDHSGESNALQSEDPADHADHATADQGHATADHATADQGHDPADHAAGHTRHPPRDHSTFLEEGVAPATSAAATYPPTAGAPPATYPPEQARLVAGAHPHPVSPSPRLVAGAHDQLDHPHPASLQELTLRKTAVGAGAPSAPTSGSTAPPTSGSTEAGAPAAPAPAGPADPAVSALTAAARESIRAAFDEADRAKKQSLEKNEVPSALKKAGVATDLDEKRLAEFTRCPPGINMFLGTVEAELVVLVDRGGGEQGSKKGWTSLRGVLRG